jgi:putative acetyltransferase
MTTDSPITICPERAGDRKAIYEVNLAAFGTEYEPQLVDNVRNSEGFIPELSLVALKGNSVVGHCLFSPITIEDAGSRTPALSLTPVAVLPALQNQGIGSALIRRGIDDARRLGHKIVVIIGHPLYYPRFGFVPARAKGLTVSFKVPDGVFMVMELVPDALSGVSGMVVFPPAFGDPTDEDA